MEVIALIGNPEQGTAELLSRVSKGDKQAQDKLVENNIGLVWSIVKKFQHRGYEIDDLFQIGCIGLIKAIKKFDTSYEVKFSTYAVPMIMGEIKRFIRDDGIIKVSRSLKETANKARVVREILTKEFGREPTIHEISKRLKIEAEEVVMALEASSAPESLFATMNEGDGSSILLIDRLNVGSDDVSKVVNRIALKEVLERLKPRERQIIFLRYFKDKTQTQIANLLGISQVQVSRIEKKVLEIMKNKISAS
jgi:RNA polymerase sporulation-specific sigma factor